MLPEVDRLSYCCHSRYYRPIERGIKQKGSLRRSICSHVIFVSILPHSLPLAVENPKDTDRGKMFVQ